MAHCDPITVELTVDRLIRLMKKRDPFIEPDEGFTPEVIADFVDRTVHTALEEFDQLHPENLQKFHAIGIGMDFIPQTGAPIVHQAIQDSFLKHGAKRAYMGGADIDLRLFIGMQGGILYEGNGVLKLYQ